MPFQILNLEYLARHQDLCSTGFTVAPTLSRWRHGFESRWGC